MARPKLTDPRTVQINLKFSERELALLSKFAAENDLETANDSLRELVDRSLNHLEDPTDNVEPPARYAERLIEELSAIRKLHEREIELGLGLSGIAGQLLSEFSAIRLSNDMETLSTSSARS